MKSCFTLIALFIGLNLFSQDCTPFIPTTVGSTWEITSFSAKKKAQGKSTYELLEKTGDGADINFKIKTTTYDKKGEELSVNTFEAGCKNGVFQVDMEIAIDASTMEAYKDMDLEIDASDLELPNFETAEAGTELKDGTLTMKISNTGMNIGSFTIHTTNRKVEARESYTCPAGTFECLVISQTTQTKMVMKIETSSKEWYAKEVGMIRSEFYNKKGVLKGYSLLTALDIK